MARQARAYGVASPFSERNLGTKREDDRGLGVTSDSRLTVSATITTAATFAPS